MNNDEAIANLLKQSGVTTFIGATDLPRPLLSLPGVHRDLLRLTNGVEIFGGYYRIFGVGESSNTDLVEWNRSQTWKFSWPNTQVARFLCFGETAWGDQFAYDLDELRCNDEPKVYFLGAFTMNASAFCHSFADFLQRILLPASEKPNDQILTAARGRFGDLSPAQHIVYLPSLLLGGEETIDNVSLMPSRVAMTLNGDLHTQLAEEEQDREVDRLEDYVDADGNPRLRVVWSDDK